MIIILFFDPTLIIKTQRNKGSLWNLYIDKSLSLNYYKQPSNTALTKGLSNFVDELKNKNIDFNIYAFGDDLDTLVNIDNLKIDANSTNIGLVFENLNSHYEANIAGGIIFTDGQVNQGPLLSRFSDYTRVPIHIIGVGDTIPMLDVAIQSVEIPSVSVKGEEVNIDVKISSTGNLEERVNITLFNEDNKLIGSKLIKVFGSESQEDVRFQIRPDKIGKNSYLVKCSALSDEINIDNNRQYFTMHVMKDEYNIALITGAPNYNTRFIKDHLSNAKNNNIDHFKFVKNQFKPSLKEFWKNNYEVIIFDNNPIYHNKNQWNSFLRIFTKKLISHNSSFFIIPGPEIDFGAISKYLEIIDLQASEIQKNNRNSQRWIFNKFWENNFSFNDSKPYLEYGVLPPQYPAFQLEKSSLNNNNYADYNFDKEHNSLIIMGEKKSLRYALWNSIDLASIKLNLLNTKNSFLIDNSLNKIFNWLMKKSGNQEFVFRTDKNSYQQGEEVLLTGRSLDFNDEVIHEGTVELFYDDKFLGSKPLYLDFDKNEYRSRFWAPKPGEINYIVKINKGLESYQVSSGIFEIQESHIELNKIYLNKEKLKSISNSSGGLFKLWENRNELLSEVSNIRKTENYITKHRLIYNHWFFSLFFLIVAVEWFLRRKLGLI
tara:strand:- start:2682 stop:4652 length:1971 start_codon:yes stop_codon:yes gene_type:complete